MKIISKKYPDSSEFIYMDGRKIAVSKVSVNILESFQEEQESEKNIPIVNPGYLTEEREDVKEYNPLSSSTPLVDPQYSDNPISRVASHIAGTNVAANIPKGTVKDNNLQTAAEFVNASETPKNDNNDNSPFKLFKSQLNVLLDMQRKQRERIKELLIENENLKEKTTQLENLANELEQAVLVLLIRDKNNNKQLDRVLSTAEKLIDSENNISGQKGM